MFWKSKKKLENPFQAIRYNEIKAEELLLRLSDIDILDEDGRNLLHEAVGVGNSDIGLKLISAGIDINKQDNNGLTPLHFAGVHQRPTLAKAILDTGGELRLSDEHGNTALWYAVFYAKEQYDTVEVFVKFRAAELAEVKNNYGKSPLDFAVQIGDQKLVELLRTD